MADEEKGAEKAAPKPVHLLLKKPVNQLVAGRIVTASSKLAGKLKKDGVAETPTKKQIGIAGGNIPHLPD